jgi:FkbM family methyltransferase
MAIIKPSRMKSLAQSSIVFSSRLFARQGTENLLVGAGAYLSAIRGNGWSPTLETEARCAVGCLTPGKESAVIDAGANVGRWLEAFQRLAPTLGQCYAFEPQPPAAELIRKRNLRKCEVIEVALGEHSGVSTFFISEQCDTTGSLFERRDTFGENRQYHGFQVKVIRLDDFVQERGINEIAFMKMDLEGGEFEALKGASECMLSGLLRAFSFEFGASNLNSRVFFRDLYDLLLEHQYEVSRITPAGRLIGVPKYGEDYENFARTTTYLARRRDRRS